MSLYKHIHACASNTQRGLTCITFQSTPAQLCAPSCCPYLQADTTKQLNPQAGHIKPSSISMVLAETFADVLTVGYWKKNEHFL